MNLDFFKGRLIVCEGADHSGKTTIAKMMVDYLNESGIPAIFTFQPGDTQFGAHAEITRDFCTKKTYNLDPLSNFFAFLLDRSESTSKVVIPALKEGKTVVADRWWYSTIAYQFYGKQLLDLYNLNIEFARWMNMLASHYIKPDIALYFQRDLDAIRLDRNDENDIFETEKEAFKQRVRNAYEIMIMGDPLFKVVDVDDKASVTLSRAMGIIYDQFQTL